MKTVSFKNAITNISAIERSSETTLEIMKLRSWPLKIVCHLSDQIIIGIRRPIWIRTVIGEYAIEGRLEMFEVGIDQIEVDKVIHKAPNDIITYTLISYCFYKI